MDLLSPGKDPVNGTQPAGVGARYDRTFEDGQGEINKRSSPVAIDPADWEKVE